MVRFAVPEKPIGLTLSLRFFDRCRESTAAVSAPGSAAPLSPRGRSGSNLICSQRKNHPDGWSFLWRRRRDLNPRAGSKPAYSLSRGAPSASWVLLQTARTYYHRQSGLSRKKESPAAFYKKKGRRRFLAGAGGFPGGRRPQSHWTAPLRISYTAPRMFSRAEGISGCSRKARRMVSTPCSTFRRQAASGSRSSPMAF